MQEAALVEVVRGGQVESRHNVSFAIADTHGHLYASWGDPGLITFLRSSAKPFQALPFVESGAADHYDFNLRDLALVCASHSGTEMHVERARQLLEKIDEPESSLQCGTHIPSDEDVYAELLRDGKSPKPIRNNCSGKHAAMLGLAKFLGEQLDTYLDPGHPVQERILKVIREMTGLSTKSIVVGVDGCSAPTFAIPLSAAARAYARLVDHEHLEEPRRAACRKIVKAMTSHPVLVAGSNRFDTLFMQAVNGRMVSKSGAEGFQAVAIPRGALKEKSPPLGIAIKVHDGDHKDHCAASLAAIAIVDRMGGFRDGERVQLKPFDRRELRNLRGINIGEIRIASTFEHDFNLNYEWL
jgi:L-asparaginase II